MKGYISDVDHFAVHDGNGIRTIVYFSGCPLRCLWCHSPELQSFDPILLRRAVRCKKCGTCNTVCPLGLVPEACKMEFRREECNVCGKCVDVCSNGALEVWGKACTLEEVLDEVLRDLPFFNNSGGGVTLSGGEVLSQPEFAIALARGIHDAGVNVIVETSGHGARDSLEELSKYCRLFYDIKGFDNKAHLDNTGVSNEGIHENLRWLWQKGADITLRVPLIPGYNDSDENIRKVYGLAAELKVPVHLLPYNSSAPVKYAWVDEKYKPGDVLSQSEGRLKELLDLASNDIQVSVII